MENLTANISKSDFTELLSQASDGDAIAIDKILPIVYEQLRHMAQGHMRRENASHTLQATALVHEAYLKLIGQNEIAWKSRAQFFAIAATLIRRVLLDHARKKNSQKRGGREANTEFLEESHQKSHSDEPSIELIDSAITRLAQRSERQAKIVELRFFAGMSIEETAKNLDTSSATVKREWTVARAWLARELGSGVLPQ